MCKLTACAVLELPITIWSCLTVSHPGCIIVITGTQYLGWTTVWICFGQGCQYCFGFSRSLLVNGEWICQYFQIKHFLFQVSIFVVPSPHEKLNFGWLLCIPCLFIAFFPSVLALGWFSDIASLKLIDRINVCFFSTTTLAIILPSSCYISFNPSMGLR